MKKLKKWMAIMSILTVTLATSLTALAGTRACSFGLGSGTLSVSRTSSVGRSMAYSDGIIVYVHVVTYTSDARHLDTRSAHSILSTSVSYAGSNIGYAVSAHYAEGKFSDRGSLTVYA